MKIIGIFYFVFFFLLCTSYAESTNSTTVTCNGDWVILNLDGWVVKNDSGVILPLSYNTTVIGCTKKPIKLYSELSGASVEINCMPSTVDSGLPNIKSVTIICK